jgi:hypothetical protein
MDRMNLAEFTETEVFVDTNIFVYALAKNHRYKNICVELLSKINEGVIIGFTSSTVIDELFHTILIGEIKKEYGEGGYPIHKRTSGCNLRVFCSL